MEKFNKGALVLLLLGAISFSIAIMKLSQAIWVPFIIWTAIALCLFAVGILLQLKTHGTAEKAKDLPAANSSEEEMIAADSSLDANKDVVAK